MGYTENLMCHSCRELKKFNLMKLEEDCFSCCQDDDSDDSEVGVSVSFELLLLKLV